MIILGSIYGAEEYKGSAIRTSLLSNPSRITLLVSKTLIWPGIFFCHFLPINISDD